MALAVNSIGSFTFLYFEGSPATWRQRVERLEYPGYQGAAIRSLGKSSGPFELVSCRDVSTITAGVALLKSYAALVGTGGHALIWRGHDYETVDGLTVRVLDVQGDASSVVQWAGAANSAHKAKLMARWTLEFFGGV